jgi:hypothetical protein
MEEKLYTFIACLCYFVYTHGNSSRYTNDIDNNFMVVFPSLLSMTMLDDMFLLMLLSMYVDVPIFLCMKNYQYSYTIVASIIICAQW